MKIIQIKTKILTKKIPKTKKNIFQKIPEKNLKKKIPKKNSLKKTKKKGLKKIQKKEKKIPLHFSILGISYLTTALQSSPILRKKKIGKISKN